MHDDLGDLATAGTGQRARQLNLWPGPISKVIDAQRVRESEAFVAAQGPHHGIRFCRALPPYLKWPIWRAKPRHEQSAPPLSFAELRDSIAGNSNGLTQSEVRQVVTRHGFNLASIPRIGIEVIYQHGELSCADRRVFLALNDHAIRNHPRGQPNDRYDVGIPALIEAIGLSKKKRDLVAASLWRLAGTTIRLTMGDQLAESWGTKLISLLPEVAVYKNGRSSRIRYDLPTETKNLINDNAITTVDMHRLQTLGGSAIAESLYLLLYDMSQWYREPQVSYPIADLAQRLGLSGGYAHAGRKKAYRDWASVRTNINNAAAKVYGTMGILRDFGVNGSGSATTFVFYFAPYRRFGEITDGKATNNQTPPCL